MSEILCSKGYTYKATTLDNVINDMAKCIEMDNLNFLIGAGCSSYIENGEELGIPTMRGLTNKFFSENPNLKINKNTFAKDKFSNSLEDYLSYLLSMCKVDFRHANKHLKNIQLIKKFIFKKVSENDNQDVLNLYKEFYKSIIKSNRKTPINVFTTNYDLYNEKALDSLKFMYNNGFSGNVNKVFNPNVYNYLLVENLNISENIWKNVNNFINLYKIHGSIDWVREKGVNSFDNIIEKDVNFIKDKYESLMIYPTPEKDRSTLMIPYSDLFRLMQNNLSKSNSILVTMGYSFGDEHINRIIFNALSSNNFRLVIFGNSQVINELATLNDKRIWIYKSLEESVDKIQYFKNIVDKILPKADDELIENEKLDNTFNKLMGILNKKEEEYGK